MQKWWAFMYVAWALGKVPPLIGRLFTVALGNILDLKSLAVAFSSASPAGRIYHRLSLKKQLSIRSDAFSLTDATAEFTDEYDRVARDKSAAHLGQAKRLYTPVRPSHITSFFRVKDSRQKATFAPLRQSHDPVPPPHSDQRYRSRLHPMPHTTAPPCDLDRGHRVHSHLPEPAQG
jgi:hypothetical protein